MTIGSFLDSLSQNRLFRVNALILTLQFDSRQSDLLTALNQNLVREITLFIIDQCHRTIHGWMICET
jgi:hypothetical protein